MTPLFCLTFWATSESEMANHNRILHYCQQVTRNNDYKLFVHLLPVLNVITEFGSKQILENVNQ